VTAFDAVVVAAGESRRMEGRDKVWASIAGRPLLAWTLEAVAAAPGIGRVALVAAPARLDELRAVDWLPDVVAAVVAGGRRRQESVAAGVRALDPGSSGNDVVLVHDGARPLASPALVSRVAAAAAAAGAAIPVLPVAETVKRVEHGRVVTTVDRRPLALAQTPQGVRRLVLEAAWQRFPPDGPETWTDEAALLEACGIRVDAIRGEPANLKVTLPDDLVRAEAALRARSGGPAGHDPGLAPVPGRRAPAEMPVDGLRIGLGEDSHPFGPGEPLALGGVEVPGAPRLHGHSDGDVALHAIGTALLGVAGLGDLGRLFPAGPETPRGIASAELLAEVRRRVAAEGLAVRWVDLTITGARPRLADRLPAMTAAIAALLEVPATRVSVKASTGNLAGMEGAGRGISARAIVITGPVGAGPADEDSPAPGDVRKGPRDRPPGRRAEVAR
jgi:2-C-methyl-D-erythritol 4-phosphate cytidylyltransferase/2-C-methyl-D-erythritol 2,4-cyclodiphosphate synthase